VELSTFLKHSARFFTFFAGKKEPQSISKMDLPEQAKVIFFYRNDQFHIVDEMTSFKEGDELVILTHSKNLEALSERWDPKNADE
jgi:trk system potassium uptake protein TrkA